MNSIEELSISALGQRMFDVFKLPHQPIECPTNDRLWMAQRQAQEKGQKVQLPILAYSLMSVGPSETQANPSAWMHRGMATSIQDDTVGSIRVLPVQLTFGVTYLDTDRVRLLRFMSRWLLARAQGTLNFRLRIDGIPIDVQVKPEESLSAPQKDITLDSPNLYEMSGNVTMNTYVSGEFEQAIKRLTRVADIVTAINAPPVLPDELPSGSTPETVIDRAQAMQQFDDEEGKNTVYSATTKVGEG